jgi:hypothetical protein
MKEEIPHIQKSMTPEMKEHLATLRAARKIADNIRSSRREKPLPVTPENKPIYLLPPSWNGKDFKLYKKTHKK